jgi:hypothetical protein
VETSQSLRVFVGRRSPSAHFEQGAHCGSAGDEDLHRGAERACEVAMDHDAIMSSHLFKDHNFKLTTVAGLITGIAMFGAMAYLPTY